MIEKESLPESPFFMRSMTFRMRLHSNEEGQLFFWRCLAALPRRLFLCDCLHPLFDLHDASELREVFLQNRDQGSLFVGGSAEPCSVGSFERLPREFGQTFFLVLLARMIEDEIVMRFVVRDQGLPRFHKGRVGTMITAEVRRCVARKAGAIVRQRNPLTHERPRRRASGRGTTEYGLHDLSYV